MDDLFILYHLSVYRTLAEIIFIRNIKNYLYVFYKTKAGFMVLLAIVLFIEINLIKGSVPLRRAWAEHIAKRYI